MNAENFIRGRGRVCGPERPNVAFVRPEYREKEIDPFLLSYYFTELQCKYIRDLFRF